VAPFTVRTSRHDRSAPKGDLCAKGENDKVDGTSMPCEAPSTSSIGTSGHLLPRQHRRAVVRERQERDLRAFAKRAGHKIVAVFKETASGADTVRPERTKVLALARAHEIDAILVTELSRWGRSTQDLVQTLDDLHGWKVSVLAVRREDVRTGELLTARIRQKYVPKGTARRS